MVKERSVGPFNSVAEATGCVQAVDWMLLFVLFLVILGGYHIHFMLTAGDWGFWIDWKDRRMWPTVVPILGVTFAAASQAFFWVNFRLPFGAVFAALGLLIGEWVNRYVTFWGRAHLPISLVFPSELIVSALWLDIILLLSDSHVITAIVGSLGWGVLFYPNNWPAIAAFHQASEQHGHVMTLADIISFNYVRTSMPEYLRVVENDTFRRFGKDVFPVAAFFSGFVSMMVYFLWWFMGRLNSIGIMIIPEGYELAGETACKTNFDSQYRKVDGFMRDDSKCVAMDNGLDQNEIIFKEKEAEFIVIDDGLDTINKERDMESRQEQKDVDTEVNHADENFVKSDNLDPPSDNDFRWLEATIEGEPLKTGNTLILYAQLVLSPTTLCERTRAKININPNIETVTLTCQAVGLKLKTTSRVTLDISPGINTDKASFVFDVLTPENCRITVSAYQKGILCGQIVIDNFSALQLNHHKSSYSFHANRNQSLPREAIQKPAYDPDLTLELWGDENEIIASSPPEIFHCNAKEQGKWSYPPNNILEKLREEIVSLYYDEDATEELLKLNLYTLGREITSVMPEKLVDKLADKRVKNLFLQVPADFNFPIEFALIEKEGDQWLVQDRVATSRWFVNSKAIQQNRAPDIHKIALAIGKMNKDASVEHSVFKSIPSKIAEFNTHENFTASVLRSDDFRMLHYFGHMERDKVGKMYLTFAGDTKRMQVQTIGVLAEDKKFFEQGPVIILNCCDSAGNVELIAGRECLPHRLIELNTLACVATFWPVASRPANKFMSSFYSALASGHYIQDAIKAARENIIGDVRKGVVTGKQAVSWELTARSYVYYGPPDLTCKFVGEEKHG